MDSITGLILAGGRGSRMNNSDKGLQILHGLTLIQHVLNRLRPQVDDVMISANRNLSSYRNYHVPVWPDHMPDYAGPLAGLHTALQHCETPYLVVVPCDSPFIPSDLVSRLFAALRESNAELAVASSQGEAGIRVHPVFCLFKTSVLPELTVFLEKGGRKVSAWQASLKTVEVVFNDKMAFRNINTMEDLQKCREKSV